MITTTLVVCAFVIGFSWGATVMYTTRVVPLRKQFNAFIDRQSAFMTEQIAHMQGVLDKIPAGPIVSPIQINPKEE
jgi:hypothetical protein